MTTGKDITRGLSIVYALMHRQTQSLLSKHDITADQYVLLALLRLEDAVTPKKLTLRAIDRTFSGDRKYHATMRVGTQIV